MNYAMQSNLADEFLRDFGAVEEDEGDIEAPTMAMEGIETTADSDDSSEDGDADGDASKSQDQIALEIAMKKHKEGKSGLNLDENSLKALFRVKSVSELSKVHNSSELSSLMATIESNEQNRMNQDAKSMTNVPTSGIENDPEYEVITHCNDIISRIQQESLLIHRYVRDIYTQRWPELEPLVPNPIDYARCIRKIGNNLSLARAELSDLLPSASIISVSVAATTTSGKPLSESDLQKVLEGCNLLISLDSSRLKLLEYIQSRMKFYAPNLSALVGTEIAAKLISIAGNLSSLGRMVSGNIQALGISKKGSLNGFSTASALSHVGVIVESDLISRCPSHLFKKAYRLLSGKCAIAARVDSFHQSPHGQIGAGLRAFVENRIEKWQEPPPAKKDKALPLPEQKKMKHRGGRRARELKQSYAMTELRVRANRVEFGKIAEEIGNDPDHSLGMLSQEGHGLLRIAANSDGKGFKIKIPKQQKTKQQQPQRQNLNIPPPQIPSSSAVATVSLSTQAGKQDLRTLVAKEEHKAEKAANPLAVRLQALQANKPGYFSTIGGFSSVKQ